MQIRCLAGLLLLLACLAPSVAPAAPLILNEYNAVASDNFLNGGIATEDEDGGTAADPHFGRVLAGARCGPCTVNEQPQESAVANTSASCRLQDVHLRRSVVQHSPMRSTRCREIL